ncbi:MAG: OmpA family protein [Bernardetiaceae bacterium]|nr:OmpA family protein [Bernardetiaceae bacterium]
MKKCFFFVFVLWLHSYSMACLWAQREGDEMPNLQFENLSSENSPLPENRINCMRIDKHNTKWIGTDNALCALYEDGTWRIFDSPKDSLLKNISAIAIDSDENKWLGSYYNGISVIKMNRKGDIIKRIEMPAFQNKNLFINDIAVDKNGNAWIATAEGGVWKADTEGKWYTYEFTNVPEFVDNRVNAVVVDRDNTVWIGKPEGLFSTETGKEWIVYDLMDDVVALVVDRDNNVCAGALDRKGRQYLSCNRELFRLAKRSSRKSKFNFAAFVIDFDGWIWGAGQGLMTYTEKDWHRYDVSNSDFTSRQATCMTLDTDGKLWIGTADKGIFSVKVVEKIDEEEYIAKNPPLEYEKPQQIKLLEVTEQTSKPDLTITEIKQTSFKIGEQTVAKGQRIELADLRFKPRSYELQDTKGVAVLLEFMKQNPTVRIELAGHTDRDPDPSHPSYDKIANLQKELSQKRVAQVAKFLYDGGIESSRVIEKALGGSEPLYPFNSEKNRRVEMKILDTE